MKREIRIIGDPVLRRKSKKVERIDSLTSQLIDDMVETMYAAPGIGLAAPQVGVNKRVVVVDIGDGLYKLINPRVVESEGMCRDIEACLSIPGKVGEVERPEKVTVKAMFEDGRYRKIEADGLFARCLQHEIDHLDGVLYVDKAENIREPEYPGEGEEMPEEDEPGEEFEMELIEEQVVPLSEVQNQPPAIFEMK